MYNKIIITLIIATFLTSLVNFASALSMNTIPDGLPPNLPTKIKGKYRLIEHDVSGSMWIAYDFNRYSRTTEGFKMLPPVYTYDYMQGKKSWLKRTDNAPLENMYVSELVTIIEAGVKINQRQSVGKQITGQEAVSKVASNVKNPSTWKLTSKHYKNSKGKDGFVVCGKNMVNAAVAGVWWCSGSKVTSVNGIAKGNTPDFEMTYDVSVAEGLSACGF